MADTLNLYATVRHIVPAVWRRVVVPADITLPALHGVLQILFDWDDCHLWQFEFGSVDYTCPDEDGDDDYAAPGRESRSAYGVGLADALAAKKKFSYWYDFGDDWHVDIKLERRVPGDDNVIPLCTDGARAGPPDDCGGVPGYFNLLEVLAGPTSEDRESMIDWLGGEFDPEAVDLAVINADLKRAFKPRKPRAKPAKRKPPQAT